MGVGAWLEVCCLWVDFLVNYLSFKDIFCFSMMGSYGSLADRTVQKHLTEAQHQPENWTVYLVPANGALRTLAQNRMYHRVLQKLAQQQGRSVAYWHECLVVRFLGYTETLTEDGTVRRELASTATLSVEEFSGFLNAVLVLAAELQVQ